MYNMSDRERLYFDALNEIAGYLGDSLEHPISASLLCLRLDITDEEKGKIIFEFNHVLRKNTVYELDVMLFKNALLNVNNRFASFSEEVVIALVKAFSLRHIPELYPFAQTI